jgi:cytochrome P450
MGADIPGDPGPPLIGHTLRIRRDPVAWGLDRYQRYGPVSWSRAWGSTIVNLIGAEAVADALRNRDGAFANGPGWGPFLEPFFTRGLMLLDFEEHRQHRRIMAEAFTPRRLSAYFASAAPRIADTIARWPAGQLTVFPRIKRLSLGIATETFLGTTLPDDAATVRRAFVDAVRGAATYVRVPVPGTRWRRGIRGRRILEEFIQRQLPAARAGDRDDLLAALCQAATPDGETFGDQDVIDHMIFLLMAAHDTATAAAVAIAYQLGRHPDWQRRARAEADEVGELTDVDDVDRLVVLDRVMREAMRLHSPVPVLARRTVAETTVAGRRVPAGAICSVGLLATHHLPEHWPDPERFDPDRFAGALPHPYAWRPFGGGAHTCIGMRFAALEIKAILHAMLRRHEWSVAAGYRLRIDYGTVPVPSDGLPVTLTPR